MNKYQRTAHAKLIISNLNWIYFCPLQHGYLDEFLNLSPRTLLYMKSFVKNIFHIIINIFNEIMNDSTGDISNLTTLLPAHF